MRYLVANFKMNPSTREEMERWLETFLASYQPVPKKIRVVLCPPFVWLPITTDWTNKSDKSNRTLALGAQDVFWENEGTYTGEISPRMLKDLGAEYVIVGHSERRALGETDDIVHKKLNAALKAGLNPILAVGEESRWINAKGRIEREVGLMLEEQLRRALVGIPRAKLRGLTVAYEPVWAIGTGLAATPDDALKAALTIRKVVAQVSGSTTLAQNLPVLYGGSVSSENVGVFLAEEGLDGVLVGGASVDAEEFCRLVKTAEQI